VAERLDDVRPALGAPEACRRVAGSTTEQTMHDDAVAALALGEPRPVRRSRM
jgi:hypothetical protein